MNSKPRLAKDYDRLSEEVQSSIKLEYPYGFEKHLIKFKNREGKFVSALPFETEDIYYLVRMTLAEAQEIIEEDDDYDDNGNLTDEATERMEEELEGIAGEDSLEDADDYD